MTGNQQSILIVDDEPKNIQLLANILKSEGYHIEYAINADEALELVHGNCFHMFLLDVDMPGINGFELCKRLKADENTDDIPVIFLSALTDLHNKVLGFEAGGCDYITKPFQIEEVIARVRTHLELQKTKVSLQNALLEKGKSNRLLEVVFQSIPEYIITVDGALKVISTNRIIDQTYLSKIDGVIDVGITLTQQFDLFYEILSRTLESNTSVIEKQICLTNQKGEEKTLVISSSPLLEESPDLHGAVLVMRDITRFIFLEKSFSNRSNYHHMIGKNKAMQEIYSLLEMVSDSEISVLIQGESGTGKELVAEAVHYGSARSEKPFVRVNCAALPDTLLESELFGHIKGAFTGASQDRIGRFQLAEGGTIFLDEIGEATHHVQLRLLRILEQKEFERIGESRSIKADVRVVAATNIDLQEKVNRNEFRTDLYYRLKGMVIHLPALKERKDDILLLAHHFLSENRVTLKKNITGMSTEVKRLLVDHSWPGNIRELKHAVEYACVMCQGDDITPEHLPAELRDQTSSSQSLEQTGAIDRSSPQTDSSVSQFSEKNESLLANEKQHLIRILELCNWNKKEAAIRLDISRSSLYEKIRRLRIVPPENSTH